MISSASSSSFASTRKPAEVVAGRRPRQSSGRAGGEDLRCVILERLTEETDPSAKPPVVVVNGTRRSCLTSPTTTLCGRPPQRAATPSRESDRSGFVAPLADGAAPVPFHDSVLRKQLRDALGRARLAHGPVRRIRAEPPRGGRGAEELCGAM